MNKYICDFFKKSVGRFYVGTLQRHAIFKEDTIRRSQIFQSRRNQVISLIVTDRLPSLWNTHGFPSRPVVLRVLNWRHVRRFKSRLYSLVEK